MEQILKEFRKKFKDDQIMYLDDTAYSSHDLGFISTGSFAIDFAIRQPGIPLGRIVELYGFPSVGKSTIAASIIGSFQKAGGIAILFDTEHSYTPNWATQFGVIPEQLILVQPGTLESCMEEMIFVVKTVRAQGTDKPVVVVHDSVAATPTQSDIDGDVGDAQVARHARILSQAMRKLVNVIWDEKISVVFINQLKERPMAYGATRAPIGGHAIPFHAAVRIELKKKMVLPESKGIRVHAQVVKNKLAAPFRESEFEIDFESGIKDDIAIIAAAEDMGMIKQGGGWYSIEGRDRKYRASELAEEVKYDVFTKIFGEDYARACGCTREVAQEADTPAEEPTVVGKTGVQVFDADLSTDEGSDG